jgi:hypothetical protein
MRIAGFEFVDGARFQSGAIIDAKAVGVALDALRKQCKGELTPQDVVDEARKPKSPLHSFFEWDESTAAEQHRLAQARGLIRSVIAIYVRKDEPAVRTKMFVHVPDEEPHYREASDALSHSKTRGLVLQRAWGELQSWRKRYADLREFAEVVEVIDEVAAKLPKAARH